MAYRFISYLRKTVADPDIALDLGTANTRLYARGQGLIADEPSIVRMQTDTGRIEEVGISAAFSLKDKQHSIVSPLRAGVVADVKATTALLTPLLRRGRRMGILRPRVLVCAPTDACEEERAALIEATRSAGASAVAIAPEPLAAAIGGGMDVAAEHAQMIVDIGDGVTDVAVIRLGSLLVTDAVRIACSDLNQAVSDLAAERYSLKLYQKEAERLVQKIGATNPQNITSSFIAAGDDVRTGSLRRVNIYGHEIAAALNPVLKEIVTAIRQAVHNLPPEIACEVIESGIRLTGGGACLPGITTLIANETNLAVKPVREPMHAVINGARQMLAIGAATNLWLDA
ncbi:MAG: rod shape-determining protein [Blastocatellia bacterium]|nr:rod shape-determining protein [Blastocatellia bacterium]